MRIISNISALNSTNKFKINNTNKAKTMEKLSSGYRINRAADDAAGLAISEKMRAQIKGLEQASRNVQDGISLIQTAEGGMQEVHSLLQRMNELAIQAANGTYNNQDRFNSNLEFEQLLKSIDEVSKTLQYNSIPLLDGSFNRKFQIGPNSHDDLALQISSLTKDALFGQKTFDTLGITSVNGSKYLPSGDYIVDISKKDDKFTILVTGGPFDHYGKELGPDEGSMSVNYVDGYTQRLSIYFDYNNLKEGQLTVRHNYPHTELVQPANLSILTQEDAKASLEMIKSAIDKVSSERAKIGAYQNRLEHTLKSTLNSVENLSSSESRIRDAEIAKEMAEFTKNHILIEAGQAMISQANTAQQSILKLLN